MKAFTITPVEKGIMRCQHTDPFTPDDVQSLSKFLEDYKGKLLIDLSGTTPDECLRNIKNFRPMMPTAAIFGAAIDQKVLDLSESYYEKEVRSFDNEGEALAWLRNQ
ncbi:MAG: STAS/SEC14 domain-containing protein [Anaerolineaceae bacterium]|nr:STAS/SEC14 domain-containing protein [Anaerolineaceae bacterium]